MASANFVVRKNPAGSAKIVLVFNYGRKKRVRYSTQFNLKNYKNWDSNKKRIKIIKEEPTAEEINNQLNLFMNYAEKLVRVYETTDVELDSVKITKDLEGFFENKSVNSKLKKKDLNQDFLKYFEWFLNFYSTNPRPKTNKPYNKGTLKTLKNTKELVERFQKHKKRLCFDDVTLSFHHKIIDFMSEHNYSVNYKGAVIKNIKTVMNDAYERDFHQNLDFKKSAFSKPTEEVENVYLTEEEIERINQVDLEKLLEDNDSEYFKKGEVKPYLDYLERCRDFFSIGCYTGLRVSDLLKLTKDNIKEFSVGGRKMKAIHIRTSKTSKLVEIPIKTALQKILDKYDEGMPAKVSDVKINLYIKKIAKAAKINEPIKVKSIKNGTTIETNVSKYEKITNHTARRSFCTNAFNSGMQPVDIMTISGHKTEKAFFTYIKSTSRDRFDKIKNHPFFQ
ncbi:MAG: tyrosine-type recombinase/integrase [Bacteroidota bacterium]